MAFDDPQVDIRERSDEPCYLCGAEQSVLVVEISLLKPNAGVFSGDLCWDSLKEAYDDPALLVVET